MGKTYVIKEETLTNIADAIRVKTGSSEQMTPSEMVTNIRGIAGQGGWVDVSGVTATKDDVLSPKVFVDEDGVEQIGTIVKKTASNVTVNGAKVSVPSGYYASEVTKTVDSVKQATPSITVGSDGLITARVDQNAGYVSTGAKVATTKLATQAATTITPSETAKIAVNSGIYTTGNIVVDAIPKDYWQVNFEIVGGTTQPTNPKENTIWINTSTAISGWAIGDYPAPSWTETDGVVLIHAKTTTSSGYNRINILKKNIVNLSPLRVWQWVNGARTAKSAKVYRNGAWSSFWTGELYTAGDPWTAITGGYYRLARKSSDVSSIAASAPTITYGTSSVTLDGLDKAGVWFTQNPIDLTTFKTITCKGTLTRGGNYERNLCIAVWQKLHPGKASIPTYYYTEATAANGLGSAFGTSITLDISGLSGDHFVGLGLTDSKAIVTQFYLS